jgi:hemerythrin-like domain-containing protein
MAEFLGGTTAEHEFAEQEHRDLAPALDRIHAVARTVGSIAPSDRSSALLDIVKWVQTVLQPHAAWEDAWLYPEIARRAGSPWATKLMTFEHLQIFEVARQLEADLDLLGRGPSRDEMIEPRGHLFALEALLRAHIEREERFLIPLLETAVDEAAMRGRSQ